MSFSFAPKEVQRTAEFERVSSLPRRRWTEEEAEVLAEALTQALRTPQGSMRLRPLQAILLREAWLAQGLFAPAGVGVGKTLPTLLFSRVLGDLPTVLITAAGLNNDGRKQEILRYAQHFAFRPPEIVHFEKISTTTGKDALDRLLPRVIVIDEAHNFKNPKAARTRRLKRYLKAHPETIVIALTGTITKRSLKDYAHILHWCLKSGSPLPLRQDVLDEWADCLDVKPNTFNQTDPGVLLDWCLPDDLERANGDTRRAARRAYGRRLAETPGVVVGAVTERDLSSKVEIHELRLDPSPAIEEAFEALRDWRMPDGTQILEALEWTRHVRTMPLGYYLKWKYPAPELWLEKRRAAGSFIREKLKFSRHLDSPKEIYDAFPEAPELKEWLDIRDTYEPETVPQWLDGRALALCASWLREGGLAITENTVFGQALAQVSGTPYFGAGGLDASGRTVDLYRGPAAVASIRANKEGRNLQHFSRMLVILPPQNGLLWQQLIARLQRPGQGAAVVRVDVLFGCLEHYQNFWQSLEDATYQDDASGLDEESHLLLTSSIHVSSLHALPQSGSWVWCKEALTLAESLSLSTSPLGA